MKGQTAVLIIFIMILLTVFIHADSPVFTIDTETHGDWVGIYGNDGYFIPGGTEDTCTYKLPEYVKMDFLDVYGGGIQYWLWYNSSDESTYTSEKLSCAPNALYSDETKTTRVASCVFNDSAVDILLSLGDTSRYVTIYTGDFDQPYNGSEARVMLVSLYDEDYNIICDYELTNSSRGCYFTFQTSGNVIFEVMTISGTNSVIQGVFFDTYLSEAALRRKKVITSSENKSLDKTTSSSKIDDIVSYDVKVDASDEIIVVDKPMPTALISDALLLITILLVVTTTCWLIFKKLPDLSNDI